MTPEEIAAIYSYYESDLEDIARDVREAIREAVAAEREACAEVAGHIHNSIAGWEIAKAIRARK